MRWPALAAALALALLPTYLMAQGPVILQGQVINGTPGGEVPKGLQVHLDIVQDADLVDSRTATVDEQGRFRFTGLPTGEGLSYFVSADYEGVTYTAQALGPGSPVTLRIYEKTTDPSSMRITGHTVVVTGADSGRRLVEFLEVVTLENRGQRTVVFDPNSGLMPPLRFSLPPGYRGLDLTSSLEGMQVFPVAQGFALLGPVPPGQHEVLFVYHIRYPGPSYTLQRRLPLGAEAFRLLVPTEVALPLAPDLINMGTTTLGGRDYRVLQAQGLEPGATLTITLVGLPMPPLWRRAWEAVSTGALAVALPPALAGALLLGLLAWALRHRPAEEGTSPGL